MTLYYFSVVHVLQTKSACTLVISKLSKYIARYSCNIYTGELLKLY